MLRKAVLQMHIGAQSSASLSRNEEFRELEADLSALFLLKSFEIIDFIFDIFDTSFLPFDICCFIGIPS